MPSTVVCEKPIALNNAISRVRSRSDMAIVLAATHNSATTIAIDV